MKKSMILILLALAQMQGAAQQKEWTLSDCINHALEHNITVRQSELNVEQREIDLNTAQGRRLPGLSASSSESLSFGRGLGADNTYTNSNTSSTSFNLGMDIPVFQGLQINKGVKMSRLDLSAAMADLAKAKDDVRVSVAQAYVQILYNQELLKVAAAQEKVSGAGDVRVRMREGHWPQAAGQSGGAFKRGAGRGCEIQPGAHSELGQYSVGAAGHPV